MNCQSDLRTINPKSENATRNNRLYYVTAKISNLKTNLLFPYLVWTSNTSWKSTNAVA